MTEEYDEFFNENAEFEAPVEGVPKALVQLDMAITPVNIVNPGKVTQYCQNGPGFTVTTSTYEKLAPGCYIIQFINQALTFVPVTVNTDSLLRLPNSKSDYLIKECETFWNIREEFEKGNDLAYGGFLHKRGYLMWGPPGSGKTCTIKFLIKDIIEKEGIVIFGNQHPREITNGLRVIKEIEPDKPIIVIFEDLDTLIDKFGESEYLAFLDGEDSLKNTLCIATTNYPSRLEPRLFNRPGRFSDLIKIDLPNKAARKLYLETKLKNKDDIDKIVNVTDKFTFDHLRSLVLGVYFEKKDLDGEIKRLKELFKPPKEDVPQIGLRT